VRLHAVNVGTPRTVDWKARRVLTSIFKSPVTGDVRVGRLNLAGDEQSDLTVHGGPDKAVYAYPQEHYAAWEAAMPEVGFTPASFGENLTTVGLLEKAVEIGDRFRIGTVLLEAAQPRIPCYKLGIRLGRDEAVRQFVLMRLPGIYFRVIEEGSLRAGGEIEAESRSASGLTVREVFDGLVNQPVAADFVERVAAATALPPDLRAALVARYS
jgi:MOSC domain-containing protein YiiM